MERARRVGAGGGRRSVVRVVSLFLFLPGLPAGGAAAQDFPLRGYLLNVATGSAEGDFSPAGLSDFQRLRLMWEPELGSLTLDAAYEHLFELVSDPDLRRLGLGDEEGGTEWLPLQGTIAQGDHAAWRHRLDRLAVSARAGDLEATVGRQAISWATTLLFTPADPFAPFDPADPFREYRAGVDAARVQLFTGPFSDVDVVVRLIDVGDDTEVVAAGRVHGAVGRWELSGWAGTLYGDPAVAAGATLSVGGGVLRAEAQLRSEDPEDGTVPRLAVGADRSFVVAGRNLYVDLEFQHDGLGAASADDLLAVALSAPFLRGELQVIGQNEAALQASWEASPLASLSALAVWNLGDGSVLLTPSAGWSLGDEATLRGGLFFGFGAESTPDGLPASEYGLVPPTAYVSLTAFF